MEEHENSVHGMWIGKIGPMELMTLKSFTDNGAVFNLWVYEKPLMRLPKGVVIHDANEIIPEDKIFKYPKEMHFGFCQDTVVGFSELFRYKVIYEHGGWWSDMDVTCLKPLSLITTPYFFRFHGTLSLVGNIFKCPPKSKLMKSCYETTSEEINEFTDDIFQAIEIMCYYVRFYGLRKYIHKDLCNLDKIWDMEPFFKGNDPLPEKWHFVHWMRSVLVHYPYNHNSTLGKLLDTKPYFL